MIEYVFFSCVTIYLATDDDFPLTFNNILIGTAAGTLMTLGRLFVSLAVAIGIAGPAQAMMSTHALHQAMWSAAIDGQVLTFWQSLGLSFGILGVFTMSLIDIVIKKLSSNKVGKVVAEISVTKPKIAVGNLDDQSGLKESDR